MRKIQKGLVSKWQRSTMETQIHNPQFATTVVQEYVNKNASRIVDVGGGSQSQIQIKINEISIDKVSINCDKDNNVLD